MKQIKILLVDDEEEFVKTLSERMQIKNLDSDFVLSGEQALESLGDLTPDVMILDLKMPGINGMDVLRQVKKDYPQVQVIILTGHGSEQDKKNVLDLGAFDYFAKPVDLDELIQSISNAYELKIETHGIDSPAESAKFMTVSMKNSRSSDADTTVKSNLDGETEAPVKETLGKLVVVGSESEFSEEIIDYGLEMARRMDYEIVALNTAPLICKNFKVFTPPWKKVCEEFQTESEENVRPFQKKADENSIGFTHAVEFVEVDDALEKLKTRFKNINLVVSKPEQLDGQTPMEPGTQPNRRKGFLVYALS
jgi:CheY-like chemotaxis protein